MFFGVAGSGFRERVRYRRNAVCASSFFMMKPAWFVWCAVAKREKMGYINTIAGNAAGGTGKQIFPEGGCAVKAGNVFGVIR